jgi:hypothetical protein
LRWIAGLGQGRTARRCWPVHGSRGKRIHCTVAACGELPLAVSGLSTHNGSDSEKIGTSLTPASSQALSLSRAHIHFVNDSCIKIMQNSMIFPHPEAFCHGSKRRWCHSPGPSQRACCHLRPPTPTPGPAGAMLNCGKKSCATT